MPKFQYETRIRGKKQTGEIEADNDRAAINLLAKKNIRVQSVQLKKSWTEMELFESKQKITEKDVVLFTRQFSTMIDAGLPMVQCLDIFAKQAENKTFGDVIRDVKTNIEVGSNLSDALRKHPDAFDSLYCNMVEAGESGGTLDVILQRLAGYIEKALALKAKVKSAMVYPSVIVGVAFIVVAFLMVFVIPSFATMFEKGGAELPWPTAVVMDVSNFFRYGWYYMIGGGVASVFIFKKVYATEKGRLEIDRYSLKAPVFGPLLRKVAVAKFTRTLATLISGGVPIIEGLNICARIAGNKIIEIAIFQTIEAIKEGETIAAPLERQAIFPPMVVQMIDVGEASGALDAMLEKIADFYDEEVDNAVEAMTSLLEPMLMVFLGVIIGFIVVAMYLPIFKMGEAT